MKKLYYLLLIVTVILFTLSMPGSHTVGISAQEKSVDVDVVGSEAGLLSVSHTTHNINSTTNTADLTVTIMNQAATTLSQVNIRVDGKTKSIDLLKSKEHDSVSFSDVSCTAVIRIQTSKDSFRIDKNTVIECS